MSASGEVEGLVLCRVGDFQLAFYAAAVRSIGTWALSDPVRPLARTAYRLPAAAGKLLLDADAAVVVDGLEISAQPLALLPVPAMLAGAAGGALRGFVAVSGALLPLLGFAAFASYLAAFEPAR